MAVSSVCCLPHSRQLVAFYMCTRMRFPVASLGRTYTLASTLPACVFKDRDLHKWPRKEGGRGGGERGRHVSAIVFRAIETSGERDSLGLSEILRASRDEDLGRSFARHS